MSFLDTAVTWPNGKIYFFKGNQYIRYDINADRADPDYPRLIYPNWRGLPIVIDPQKRCFDAVITWPNGKAYFFKNNQYYRYDINADHADPGYPKPIKDYWPGIWESGIDAAIVWSKDRAYFFKGDQYIRYNIKTDRAEGGYPKPIFGANWPALDWNGTGHAEPPPKRHGFQEVMLTPHFDNPWTGNSSIYYTGLSSLPPGVTQAIITSIQNVSKHPFYTHFTPLQFKSVDGRTWAYPNNLFPGEYVAAGKLPIDTSIWGKWEAESDVSWQNQNEIKLYLSVGWKEK